MNNVVVTYTRRVRTGTAIISPFSKRLYAPSFVWGYRPGSSRPEWFRAKNIEPYC